ncbi:FAD-dependent oxidoreductase, partial [Paraburkholderia sp. BR14262]|uniref:FAD-dependent oxidoreductase n=1 Tax=Paraburkholderia sp. BR14262 TaxID=3236999 RepID=UPI0034CD882C
ADVLRERVKPGEKLVVIGAGYIGLEAAAAARQLGHEVTVLEAAPRVLGRVTGEIVSTFYANEHRAQGVELRLNAKIEALVGEGGKLTGVKLADGEIVPATLALVGIGILPNEALAKAAGNTCANAIQEDDYARTSDPD